MAASYPVSVKTFSTKVDFDSTVLAEHVNSLQDEVHELETYLGTAIVASSGWVGTFTRPSTDWNTLKDRINNIEYGINKLWTAVPAGGTTGQILTKTAGTDYATAWQTFIPLPTQFGNDGEYLKTDGTSATWEPLETETDKFSTFLLAGC